MFVTCEEEEVAMNRTTKSPFRPMMREAYRVAFEASTDRSTKNGAIIVGKRGDILVSGANAFIDPAMANDMANHERPRKYKLTEHAERAAIYEAAFHGVSLRGLTMVCPWACCSDCARAIVLSGISLVIAHQQAFDMTPDRWKEEVALGIEILESCGVCYTLYDGEVDEIENLFNGRIWFP